MCLRGLFGRQCYLNITGVLLFEIDLQSLMPSKEQQILHAPDLSGGCLGVVVLNV